MERREPVTQEAVNNACSTLTSKGNNVSVNAVIGMIGGSFTTVGKMVKAWKKEQAELKAIPIEMPDSVSNEMKRATVNIWKTATELANTEVEKVKEKATEADKKAKEELLEYEEEVLRLERELEKANEKREEAEASINDTREKLATEKERNIVLVTQLKERDKEIERLHEDHAELQAELIAIAKSETTKKQPKTRKTNHEARHGKEEQGGLFQASKDKPLLISTPKGQRLAKYSFNGFHWHGLGGKPKWLIDYEKNGGKLDDIRVNKNFKMSGGEITRIK